MILCLPAEHPVGSICYTNCPYCKFEEGHEIYLNLWDGDVIPQPPLYILRKSTRQEWEDFARSLGVTSLSTLYDYFYEVSTD